MIRVEDLYQLSALQLNVSTLLGKLDPQNDRIKQLESGFNKFRELQLLGKNSDKKLIDIITEHVLETGMSVKIRELKNEFFSK